MDALREYSLSDEEIQGNGTRVDEKPSQPQRKFKTAKQKHDQHHRSNRKSPPSSPDAPHRSPSPKRKHSSSNKPSHSPHPSRRHTSPPVRRRSRSPHSNRGYSKRDHHTGSSHNWFQGDIRGYSSSHNDSSRHYQRRSRSPSRRHSNTTDSRHQEEDKAAIRSGMKNEEGNHGGVKTHETDRPQWSNDDSLTPEQKLEQALTASRASKPKTVPGLPSYINPAVINPKHFQTIQQKRKLLWGKAKEKETKKSWNKWESASFEGDNKGETQSKFRRLMGIKDDGPEGNPKTTTSNQSNKLLDDLEAQYEVSRFMTHLAKGAGLGYGTGAQITQNKVNPNDTDNINESHAHR